MLKTEPEPSLAGACGAYCGACLAYRGELAAEAGRLLQGIRRQGFLGLAKRLHPAEGPKVDVFFDVLDRLARTPACPGCAAGGGPMICPVRVCAKERRLETCAHCADLSACADGRLKSSSAETRRLREGRARLRGEDAHFPFGASEYLARLVRKYQGWNLENLRRIAAEGLEVWEAEMRERADAGFRSVEIKSEEDVYADD
ncbi:MAG: DUF3795 domain-containing protein [Deltaproteobacteria bacterium]|nr:DUF3795 domain-containing protein [Deltaproteobacteria bacterium]